MFRKRFSPGRLLLSALAGTWLLTASILNAQTIRLPQAGGGDLLLDAPAQRIVTLAPHLTELVYAVGLGEHLVATVQYSDYPPAANEVLRVGDAFRIDLEQLIGLQPDLVIGWHRGNPAALLDRLEELGQPLWRTEVSRLPELPELIRQLGRAGGAVEQAGLVADDVQQRIDALVSQFAAETPGNPVRYFYQISPQPLYTFGGQHLVSQGLARCGGENVFAGLDPLAPTVGRESVLAAAPEVIFAPDTGEAQRVLDEWRRWPELPASRNGHLYYLPADSISRSTPRLLDALERACHDLGRARASRGEEARQQQ